MKNFLAIKTFNFYQNVPLTTPQGYPLRFDAFEGGNAGNSLYYHKN